MGDPEGGGRREGWKGLRGRAGTPGSPPSLVILRLREVTMDTEAQALELHQRGTRPVRVCGVWGATRPATSPHAASGYGCFCANTACLTYGVESQPTAGSLPGTRLIQQVRFFPGVTTAPRA